MNKTKKKWITTAMAFLLALSVCVPAFAAAPAKSEVQKEAVAAAAYLEQSGLNSFTADSSRDFLLFLRAGADVSAYKDTYLQSVKDKLNETGGRLGSMQLFANILLCLDALGEDVTDFAGFDLPALYAETDPAAPDYNNPYYYKEALESAALFVDDTAFQDGLLDGLLAFYKMGEGMDYYGCSSDNTAYFIAALCAYDGARDVSAYLSDATAVLENHKTQGGYFSNAQYGTEPNADSTALALMAYAALGNTEKCAEVYADLAGFKGSGDGIYTYAGTDSAYATRDALTAFGYYLPLLEDDTPQDTTAAGSSVNEEQSTTGAAQNSGNEKSPATGAQNTAVWMAAGAAAVIALSGFGLAARRKTQTQK